MVHILPRVVLIQRSLSESDRQEFQDHTPYVALFHVFPYSHVTGSAVYAFTIFKYPGALLHQGTYESCESSPL